MSKALKPMFLQTAVCSTPGCTFITLNGELDSATAPILAAVVDRELPHAAAMAVFDLVGLHFVDVAGTRALMRAVDQARSTGRVAIAFSPPRPVERVLRLLGVADELDLRPPGATCGPELQLSSA